MNSNRTTINALKATFIAYKRTTNLLIVSLSVLTHFFFFCNRLTQIKKKTNLINFVQLIFICLQWLFSLSLSRRTKIMSFNQNLCIFFSLFYYEMVCVITKIYVDKNKINEINIKPKSRQKAVNTYKSDKHYRC